MSKLFYGFSILLIFLFVSCATTEIIPCEEIGLREGDFSGEFVNTQTSGIFSTNMELEYTAKWAKENGYKYIVVLDERTASEISGIDDDGSILYRRSGNMIAYCFSDEEEYNSFLDNKIGIYRTEKYAENAVIRDKQEQLYYGVYGGLCVGATIACIILLASM